TRSRFWAAQAQRGPLNERQRKLLQRLLLAGDGGFLGGLNVEEYLKMVDASKATATRDLSDLVRQGLLHTRGQGKALRYYISVPVWTQCLADEALGRSSAPDPEPQAVGRAQSVHSQRPRARASVLDRPGGRAPCGPAPRRQRGPAPADRGRAAPGA